MKASATTTVHFARKGKDGIGITVSPQSVVFRQDSETSGALESVYVDFYVGGEKINYGSGEDEFLCSRLASTASVTDGLSWSYNTDSDGRFYFMLVKLTGKIVNITIPFSVIYKGVSYQSAIMVTTVPSAERGAARRGPAAWKDYPSGYAFESGASGETFFDVVYNVIGGKKYHYVCKKSHDKATDKEPGVSANWNTYWESTSEIPFLEAKYALMDWIDANTVALKNLTLISSAIPNVGDIRGVPSSIAVTETAATGENGSGAADIGSASAPKSVTVTKTVTISGKGYGRCYFDSELRQTMAGCRHTLNVLSVSAKVNGTAVTSNGYGFGFSVSPAVTSYKIEVTYTYWLRYTGSVSSGGSQLSQYKVEAAVAGFEMGADMKFFPRIAPDKRDPRTVIGTNGFLTTDDDEMLFHVQHDTRTVGGITYPKSVTMLVGDYGIRITTSGIEQTHNGGLGWLAGYIEDK